MEQQTLQNTETKTDNNLSRCEAEGRICSTCPNNQRRLIAMLVDRTIMPQECDPKMERLSYRVIWMP